jgi:hypothetical protein
MRFFGLGKKDVKPVQPMDVSAAAPGTHVCNPKLWMPIASAKVDGLSAAGAPGVRL